MKKAIVLFTLVLLVLIGCTNQGSLENDFLARVNGEDITAEQFEREMEFTISTLKMQGYQITDEMIPLIEEEILDMLIRNTLLAQHANKENYEISESEINSTYQLYVNDFQGEENLLEALAHQNMTKDEFFDELEKQLRIDKFLLDYIEENDLSEHLHISDEEIIEEFEKFKELSGMDDLVLQDYYMAIRYTLEEEKMFNLVNLITSNLLEDSEIIYNQ